MNTPSVDPQITSFLGKYSPEVEGELRDARARLRALFSRGFELVYDNYNALVFAISPTTATADAFISVTGYPKWVTLFFLHGASLNDPNKLLEGQGKQVRGIRLKTAAAINTPEVESLILQAAMPFRAAFLVAPPLSTVVKAVVAKQRPRRPASGAPVGAGKSKKRSSA
jgi:hypothetical protein